MKKGYGCTKSSKVCEIAGWTCCGKQRKSTITAEKVLPKLDKQKSSSRKYVMMRCLYTLLFLSNLIVQCFNFNA